LKRILDVVIAPSGFLLAGPLMLLTIPSRSSSIRVVRPLQAGPRRRVRHVFTILKFSLDAHRRGKAGAQFAKENDDRVTRVGKFIRKTRLDELPQLWNVLKAR